MGKTVNEIFIKENFREVFKITNDISNWTSLFSEYKKTEVIEERKNYIKFKLTKKNDENGKEISWISERFFDENNKIIHARRLEPLYPFRFMNITWEYEENEGETKMIWIQEFEVDSNCPHSEEQMENYLNMTSRQEMNSIKKIIEERMVKI